MALKNYTAPKSQVARSALAQLLVSQPEGAVQGDLMTANTALQSLEPGQSLSYTSERPLSPEEKMGQLRMAGYKTGQNELGEQALDPSQLKNPYSDQITSLRDYMMSRPTKMDATPLVNFANYFAKDPKRLVQYTPPAKEDTDQGHLEQYAQLTKLLSDQSDKSSEKQAQILKDILSMKGDKYQFAVGQKQPQIGANGTPKPRNPTQSEIDHLSEAKSAVEGVSRVRKAIEENKDLMGPMAGTYYSMGRGEDSGMIAKGLGKLRDAKDPNAPRAAALMSEIDRMRQFLGKPTEGGVLRKEDEIKYRNIIGEMATNPEVAIADLENFTTELSNRAKERLNLMRSSNIYMGPEFQRYETDFGSSGARPHIMPADVGKAAAAKKVLSYDEWVKAGKPAQ